MSPTIGVLEEIRRERVRQTEKHGDQAHLPLGGEGDLGSFRSVRQLFLDSADWEELARAARRRTKAASQNEGGDGSITFEHILTEEVFEAYAETDPAKIRAELVQTAAVCVQAIEAIDKRRAS